MSVTIKNCANDGEALLRFLINRAEFVSNLQVDDLSKLDENSLSRLKGRLKRLKKLRLNVTHSTDEISPALLSALTTTFNSYSLDELQLNNFTNIQDVTISSMLGGLNSLTYINLNNCSQLTDATLVALSRQCKQLSSIACRATHITDAGLGHIAGEVTSLVLMDFGACDSISDTGVEAVAVNNSRLQTAVLDNCRNVSDKSLMTLAAHCADLENIDLKSTGVKTVPYMVVNLKNLKTLNIDDCDVVYPPRHVFNDRSLKQLKAFYEDYDLETRIKLFVMGDPGVGKSSVISALTNDRVDHLDFSCNIPIMHWKPFEQFDDVRSSLLIEIWELPDHPVQQGIGELFYTSASSIYLIVADLSTSSVKSVPKYVATILAQVPDAHVLIVCTRLDRITSLTSRQSRLDALNRQLDECEGLRARFVQQFARSLRSQSKSSLAEATLARLSLLASGGDSRHVSMFCVSCKTRKGVGEVRECLLDICTQINDLQQPIKADRADLLRFYHAIIDIRNHPTCGRILLSDDEMAQLGERLCLSNRLSAVLNSLASVGAICNFTAFNEQQSFQSSFYCINPVVLLKLIVRLYSFDSVDLLTLFGSDYDDEISVQRRSIINEISSRGFLPSSLIPRLWKDVAVADDQEKIINLLQQVGLLCEYQIPPPLPDYDLLIEETDSINSVLYQLPLLGKMCAQPPIIQWTQQLPTDDVELELALIVPGLSLLDNFLGRLFPSIAHNFADFSYTNVTANTTLLVFAQARILVSYSSSTIDSITLRARCNTCHFPFKSLLLTLNHVWYHVIFVLRYILNTWLLALNGLAMQCLLTLRAPPSLKADASLISLGEAQFDFVVLLSKWITNSKEILAENIDLTANVEKIFPLSRSCIGDTNPPDLITIFDRILNFSQSKILLYSPSIFAAIDKDDSIEIGDQQMIQVIDGGCLRQRRQFSGEKEKKRVRWKVERRRSLVSPAVPLMQSMNANPSRLKRQQENAVKEFPSPLLKPNSSTERLRALEDGDGRQSQLSFSEAHLSRGPDHHFRLSLRDKRVTRVVGGAVSEVQLLDNASSSAYSSMNVTPSVTHHRSSGGGSLTVSPIRGEHGHFEEDDESAGDEERSQFSSVGRAPSSISIDREQLLSLRSGQSSSASSLNQPTHTTITSELNDVAKCSPRPDLSMSMSSQTDGDKTLIEKQAVSIVIESVSNALAQLQTEQSPLVVRRGLSTFVTSTPLAAKREVTASDSSSQTTSVSQREIPTSMTMNDMESKSVVVNHSQHVECNRPTTSSSLSTPSRSSSHQAVPLNDGGDKIDEAIALNAAAKKKQKKKKKKPQCFCS